MDLLQHCAFSFKRLLPYEYRFTIGRKGRLRTFTLNFDSADFHHLAGLHKLKDNIYFQTGKRSDIFQEILSGKLSYSLAEQSIYFHKMESRLAPLAHLESFLDSNEIIFRFNQKALTFSLIQADYLLENQYEDLTVYLFLSQRTNDTKQTCRSFFPKTIKDYTAGQPRYTLLKKEKVNLQTGIITVQYDRLSPQK